MSRIYENRYWEFSDEKNKFGERAHKLHFTEFYEDNVILGFVKDTGDSDTYLYTSEFLNVEYDSIIADSVEDAKEQFEEMILEHIEDEISSLESMKEKFNEEKIY